MNKKITLSIALMLMANANAFFTNGEKILNAIDKLITEEEAQQSNQTTDLKKDIVGTGGVVIAANAADNAAQTKDLRKDIADTGRAAIVASAADNAHQTQTLTNSMDTNTGKIQSDIHDQTAYFTAIAGDTAIKSVADTKNNIDAAEGNIIVNDNSNKDAIIHNDNTNTNQLYNQNKLLQKTFDELQKENFGDVKVISVKGAQGLMDTMQNNAQQNAGLVMLSPIANNTVHMDYASPSLAGTRDPAMPPMSMPIAMDLSGNTISTQLSPSFVSSNAANASAVGDATTNAVNYSFNDATNTSTHSTTNSTSYADSLNTLGGIN
jgi:hypothetical protein